jgi:glucokinase
VRLGRIATGTPSDDGPAAVVRACTEALIAARDGAPADVAASLVGIGISSPGPVDPWQGVILEPPNLGPAFRDVPLAGEVEAALDLPAYLDRDTNVAALGERAFGAARDCEDFLYITISTGIGGSIVSRGRLVHGPDGTAGELGHLPLVLDGPRCGCGGVGHLEAFASGVALARAATRAEETGASAFLVERRRREPTVDLTARDVADGEDAGDTTCAGLMDLARRAFAAACVGFVNIFNPAQIIVGGAIAAAQGDRLLGPARNLVAAEAFTTPRNRVRIVPAALGGDVSLAGALPLVSARLGDPAWRRGRPPFPLAASAQPVRLPKLGGIRT